MKAEQRIWMLLIFLSAATFTLAQAQDSSTSSAGDAAQQNSAAPSPAFGQEPVAPPVAEAPPLTGLDEAALEPNLAARSFLAPSFRVSQCGSTNANNSLGGNRSWTGVTHLQGSVDLQRLWSRYQTSLDYAAGVSIFNNSGTSPTQVHRLYFDQRMLWRRGVLQIRDSASYLPEGSFGFGAVAGGSLGGGGLGGLGGGGFGGGGGAGGGGGFTGFGGATFGGVGNVPRLNNTTIIDISETLTPRSSITLAGGYGILHFTHAAPGFIDSRQVSGQFGYNYSLSRRSTVAVMYGYRNFVFPSEGSGRFENHVVHVLYGYQLSGRMSLLLGGGPQFLHFSSPVNGSTRSISGSGRATIRYRFTRASVSLDYDHFTSGGSGFFAGAKTDLVRLNGSRQMGRLWTLDGDIGYTVNRRLQTSQQGANATSYSLGYGGVRLNRILRRTLTGYAFYRFNEQWFSNSVCIGGSTNCGRVSNRTLVGLGLDWHPQAIRLD
jgi:hypothetical protein